MEKGKEGRLSRFPPSHHPSRSLRSRSLVMSLYITDAQGRNQVFAIKRCPYLGGRDYMKLTGIFGTRKTVPKERGAGPLTDPLQRKKKSITLQSEGFYFQIVDA